ncbi:MAG: hypothetical protein HC896_15125 [Bacteroidales bacterium]|nr:hypothetical protein [Bacteroidales bacterium]
MRSTMPSMADMDSGIVLLTLTSTNNGGCNAEFSDITLRYVDLAVVEAGTNKNGMCQ